MKKRFLIITTLIAVLAMVGLAQAQDDGRINMVGHFGGDNLYCDNIDGCTLLNTDGEFLWNVPKSVIDETFTNACEVGISQEIEAGMGTYGPSLLVISCYEGYEPTLKLKAFDEHGKINEIRFPRDYSPVSAATAEPTEETATPTPSATPSPTPSPTPPPCAWTPTSDIQPQVC
ncbi:MAG: hypothetical protein CL607_08165 [Anaerolineaceae bacterium]|nr:hypothetical protein [Anaerolineaceae bacterium]